MRPEKPRRHALREGIVAVARGLAYIVIALAVHAVHSDMNVITVIYLLMFRMRMT
jgi:hypothetical protein